MNKVIITGMNGTLAPVLAKKLENLGCEAVTWNRHEISPDDDDACRKFLESTQPDAICHLAMGNADWAERLAKLSQLLNIKLLFTSTAMVFHHQPNGPHFPEDETTALDDYGKSKIACEKAILANNPSAIIARLGWQIDWHSRGNNMFHSLCLSYENDGIIQASDRWFPATSFMIDTCDVLIELLRSNVAGLYQIDSNREDKLSFADIVQRISTLKGLNWRIMVNQDYVHDQRLPDKKIKIPNISSHL